MPSCTVGSQAGITPQLPTLPGKQPVEAQIPMADLDCQECPQGAAGGDAAPPAVLGEQLPEVDEATELQEVPGIPAEQPGRDGEQDPRRASTSTPKAAWNGNPAALQVDGSPQGLETLLFQDSPSKSVTEKSKMRRRSGVGAPRKSHRASLAEKCSLASRRENMIRRSISRARARKAAARESSSASSRVSCESLHCFHVGTEWSSSSLPPAPPNLLVLVGSWGSASSQGVAATGEAWGAGEFGVHRLGMGKKHNCRREGMARLIPAMRAFGSGEICCIVWGRKVFYLWHLPALPKINRAESAALKLG